MTGQEDRQVLYWVSVNLPVGIHSQCQPPPLLFHPLYPFLLSFFFFNPCHLLRVCPTDGGCAGQLVLSFRKGSRFHRHVALAGCRYILVGNIARRSIQLQSIIHNNDSVFFFRCSFAGFSNSRWTFPSNVIIGGILLVQLLYDQP